MAPDRIILQVDRALRTIFGVGTAERASPAQDLEEPVLDPGERRHAAALMRVNHCGEVCAQALYQGQALASSSERVRTTLEKAAGEESDHLSWSAERVRELGGRLSVLNPLWYAGSFAIGYVAGRRGDEWNLGFLAETESQVERHLQGHMERLGNRDARTRAVIEGMRLEEMEHRRTAELLGARELPEVAKRGMRLAARLMTTLSYWI